MTPCWSDYFSSQSLVNKEGEEMPNRCLISQASQIVTHAQSSSNSTTQLSSSTTSTKTKLATHCCLLLLLFLPLFFFLVSETPWCEEAPRFPQLTTASHSHFICPLLPLPLPSLYSSQTRLYLGAAHSLSSPPPKRPERVTRDSQPTLTLVKSIFSSLMWHSL